MTDYNAKTLSDKLLKKEFEIVVPLKEVNKEIDERVNKYKETYHLDGFRKGKVPASLIKERHGEALLAEASEELTNNIVQELIKEKGYRIALRPKVDFKTLEADKDITFTVIFELFPEIPEIKFNKIVLDKVLVEVTDKDIDKSVENIINLQKEWKEEDLNYKAKKGDSVNIDFVGKIKGEPFEGGEGKDYKLELGSNSFIEGFEEQLIGKKVGDEVLVKVKFPKDYHKADLAKQPAEFEVKINKVLTATKPELTPEYLKKHFNVESLDTLRQKVKEQTQGMYDNIAKNNLKADLFDWIGKNIKLEVPEGLVEEQFKKIWESVEYEMKDNPKKFKTEKDKEKAKKENRKRAEEMVKVGLVLSELGREHKIQVSNEEIMKAIYQNAQNFPGNQEMFINYYRNNKDALNEITGALLEEKVIDFVLTQIKIRENTTATKDFAKKQNKRLKKNAE